jgi:hypothetical protein
VSKTFGKLELEQQGRKGEWKITDLAPHVAIHFKRLFTKVPQTATDIVLSDNDDTRADLLWFMARYPFETMMMSELEAGARRVAKRIADRDEILTPAWTAPPIKGLKPGKAPYLYQAQAAKITLDNGGLLLGDEVGLGKTECSITMMLGAPLPAAVVVNAHLAEQWQRRISGFCTLRTHVIRGTQPYTLPPADVYIFRYSNIGGWIDFLKNGLIKTVVYDELQELRHGTDTDKGRCCAIVSSRAKVKMGLTATPIYNYGDEMHTVMSFINPDLLGTREEFLREWCKSGAQVKDPDALGAFLRDTGWFLRRTEDDDCVDVSMPPPNAINVKVAWDHGAVEDETALLRTLALSVLEGSFAIAGNAARELDMRMRMMTGIAKAKSVAAYVRMLLRGGARRVLVAAWHRDVYEILRKALADYEPVLYTGSETANQKARTVEDFTKGNSRVMMISLRSGAGLDGLQHYCNDVVFGELDWSPQVHHQVVGRLRRPGQEEQVNAHTLWTDEGSDPVLIETLGIKSDQSRGINDPGASPRAKVSDTSRVKRLAQFVLDGGAGGVTPPCEVCEQPSTGTPRHIIPLEQAHEYPAGPERDALYGPENMWFLCEPCAEKEAAAA